MWATHAECGSPHSKVRRLFLRCHNICRYKDDAEDTSACNLNSAVEIVGFEAIKEHQALVQDATCFTLNNSRIATIVRHSHALLLCWKNAVSCGKVWVGAPYGRHAFS